VNEPNGNSIKMRYTKLQCNWDISRSVLRETSHLQKNLKH